MTRKEAIKHITTWMYATCDLPPLQVVQALDMAVSALRPVSREQIEKVWRGAWNYSHTEVDHFAVVKCSKCGYETYGIAIYVTEGNFCPNCGAPLTDKGVQIVMERLEALHGETEAN